MPEGFSVTTVIIALAIKDANHVMPGLISLPRQVVSRGHPVFPGFLLAQSLPLRRQGNDNWWGEQ
jgi:hypothetical protein